MLKVLLVDSDLAPLRGIDWGALGCAVVGEETDGEAGLAAAERLGAELIVTDVTLARIDGLSMLERLRSRGFAGQFIVVSERAGFDELRGALRLGAADYLRKPLREGELIDAVIRVQRRERAFSGKLPPREEELSLPEGDKSRYVRQALAYIASHYADPDISISAIARAIGVSEGHLSHLFKREAGCTVLHYLTRYRLQTARTLLSGCRYKVYEVAAMVGYRDVAYFSALFKRFTGLSPSEYQERCN